MHQDLSKSRATRCRKEWAERTEARFDNEVGRWVVPTPEQEEAIRIDLCKRYFYTRKQLRDALYYEPAGSRSVEDIERSVREDERNELAMQERNGGQLYLEDLSVEGTPEFVADEIDTSELKLPSQADKVRAALVEGLSVKDTSTLLGLSYHRVYQISRRLNLPASTKKES